MATPTLSQIGTALRTVLSQVVANMSAVQIVPESSSFNPDVKHIVLLQALRPSSSTEEELGGRLGLSKRHGVYTITISIPFNVTERVTTANALAETLCDAYRRKALPTVNGDVYCGEPSFLIIGKDPDERYSLSVSVPYTTWTGGVA